jgi:hypothetical protein
MAAATSTRASGNITQRSKCSSTQHMHHALIHQIQHQESPPLARSRAYCQGSHLALSAMHEVKQEQQSHYTIHYKHDQFTFISTHLRSPPISLLGPLPSPASCPCVPATHAATQRPSSTLAPTSSPTQISKACCCRCCCCQCCCQVLLVR